MERILGLDIGDKYIGIAVSDPLKITAQPYRTYRRASREEDLAFFRDVAEQFRPSLIVAGLPLSLDGGESAQTRKAKNYAGFLKNALGIPVVFWDERLTTEESHDILSESGIRKSDRKQMIDTVAAQIILQEYLEANRPAVNSNQNSEENHG
ncbi:MAG: Holliday junction resolvase RuvX [Eubacteriaceae bacterium]|jgi:putative Holliday junction resolvase